MTDMPAIRLVLALASLLLAGCREAAERIFRPPEAELRGVRLGKLGGRGGSLEITLAIRNPNGYRLTATGASYRLLVSDSIEVGHGASTDTVSLGARDSVKVRLPVEVDWAGLQRALRGAAEDGQLSYRIVGDIRTETPLGAYDVPLNARGRAKVPTLFR
jgi:LEA14-like dessication related protein